MINLMYMRWTLLYSLPPSISVLFTGRWFYASGYVVYSGIIILIRYFAIYIYVYICCSDVYIFMCRICFAMCIYVCICVSLLLVSLYLDYSKGDGPIRYFDIIWCVRERESIYRYEYIDCWGNKIQLLWLLFDQTQMRCMCNIFSRNEIEKIILW